MSGLNAGSSRQGNCGSGVVVGTVVVIDVLGAAVPVVVAHEVSINTTAPITTRNAFMAPTLRIADSHG